MSWGDIDRAELINATHIWIVYQNRHYDSECPEGVDSFFDLPLFRRHIISYLRENGIAVDDVLTDDVLPAPLCPTPNPTLFEQKECISSQNNQGNNMELSEKIEIAKGFVSLHKKPFEEWSVPLLHYQLSEDEQYERVFHSIMNGEFGECRGTNAEYDADDNLVKEATEFEIEIDKFDSKSGQAVIYDFEIQQELEDQDFPRAT